MAVYGPGCHPQNIIWSKAKLSWGPYTILWVTDLSINCHLARSAMNYFLYYTQYTKIFQTKCFYYCISKTKNEFGQNPEENIILIGPVQYYTIIVFCWGQYEFLWTLKRYSPKPLGWGEYWFLRSIKIRIDRYKRL
jgi:hypothetical protein